MFPNKRNNLEQSIHANHVRGVRIKEMLKQLEETERTLEADNRKLRAELLSLKDVPAPILMFDSIDPSTIPPHALAVAGYVGGHWPDYLKLVNAFPKSIHVSIAVTAFEDADCLDVESGDASPWQTPFWVRRQQHRGVKRPKIYADLSTMPEVKIALISHGIARDEVTLWVALYDEIQKVPKGYDAKQFTDKWIGRNLDASVCLPSFFQ